MFMKLLLSGLFLFLINRFGNVTILGYIGLYALHIYCLDNFESLIQIGIALLKKYFIPSKYQSLKTRFGDWAVVTGATDGIGQAYVKQLARRGLNIILISRSRQKLAKLANEIEQTYNVQTKYIVVDFRDGKNLYARIETELGDIPIGILVNCVGRMYDYPDELCRSPIDVLWSMINMNIGAMLTMTHIVLKGMKERKRGAIVNISSGSELFPIPYCTLYAATKVFVRHFTIGLQSEFAPYGISVQLVTPFCVQTKFHKFPTHKIVGSVFFPHVETFAKWAVFTIGKTTETTGYWAHAILNGAFRLMPVYVRTLIGMKQSMRLHKAHLKEKRNVDTVLEPIDA